jgi:flagellar biosynthesis/type III secretory pathway M-ring protein FliF/YscJ
MEAMKARAVLVIDYEFDGFREAGEEEEKLASMLKNIVTGNKSVVNYQMDMKERRGDALDIKKMKFRNN